MSLKMLGPMGYQRFINHTKHFQVIDTTNTPYYGIEKFLSILLRPLTQKDYSVKDSFEAVNRIHSIPSELFDQWYQYYSFDVVSIFTNVPFIEL